MLTDSEIEIWHFPLTLLIVLTTLSHYRVRCDTAFICSETESEVSDTSQPMSAVTSTGNESRHGGGASSHYTADTVWIE